MAGGGVENDDVAGAERRRELGFDISLENVPVHRRVDDPRSAQSITAEAATKVWVFQCPNGAMAFRR